MKLGLVRHFKVITNYPQKFNSSEFEKAMYDYDFAPIKSNGLQINSDDWDICYCSTLQRASKTANEIYNGNIIESEKLIEVPIKPAFNTNRKFSLNFWHITSRLAWFFNSNSQPEGRDGTKKRVRKIYKELEKSGYENILIVSHGYFLYQFARELRKFGFYGDIEINIRNGKLYTIKDY